MPAALQRRPVLAPDLLPVWDAFVTLHGTRPIGFGIGAIALSEIGAYLDLAGIDDAEERQDWVRWLRAMDDAFLADKRKEDDAKAAARKAAKTV